jgi:hypothetical protein
MAPALHDLGTSVPADVDETGEVPHLVAHHDDGHSADLGGDEVARSLERPDVADVLPTALENHLAFAVKDVLCDVPSCRQCPAVLDRRNHLVGLRHGSPHVSTHAYLIA